MRFAPFAFESRYVTASLVTDGLVFDFRSQDYVSGSILWNAVVGDYTASVTGTLAGGLTYTDGTEVGFNGNQWLQFSNNMTASISSSEWQVYAYVEFANAQTASTAFTPAFFSKGSGYAPSWNWYYKGGGAFNPGWVYTNGYDGAYNEGGEFADNYNQAFAGNSTQLFGFTIDGSPTGSQSLGFVSPNASTTIPGNAAAIDTALYRLNSFTGSAAEPLLFGKAFSGNNTNISGSVIRLFGYNRILTLQERKNNWFALSGQYIP